MRRRPKNDDGSFRSERRWPLERRLFADRVEGRRMQDNEQVGITQPFTNSDPFHRWSGLILSQNWPEAIFRHSVEGGERGLLAGCCAVLSPSLAFRQLAGKRLDGDFPIWARFLGSRQAARGGGLDSRKHRIRPQMI